MGLMDGDSICFAATCEAGDAVMVACSEGKVVTYPVSDIRPSGRNASGMRGKRLSPGALAVLPHYVLLKVSGTLWLPMQRCRRTPEPLTC